MNILLDTHIAIWAITDDARLTKKARDLILDPGIHADVPGVGLYSLAVEGRPYYRGESFGLGGV